MTDSNKVEYFLYTNKEGDAIYPIRKTETVISRGLRSIPHNSVESAETPAKSRQSVRLHTAFDFLN